MSATKEFRNLLSRPGPIILPAVGDALTARLAAMEGYKAVLVSGNAGTAVQLGLPDLGLMTMSEHAQNASRIAGASGLPVIVDADTGYGNPINVRRTVSEFERIGAAGIVIEDQVSPKRCGMLDGKDVNPDEEMVAKIKATLDAWQDPDFSQSIVDLPQRWHGPQWHRPLLDRKDRECF